jgi:hypothetical protein
MGKNCFLCGCFPDRVKFNNEHVVPDWLLRYTDISNEFITLPNSRLVRYSSYKVRSCAQCNSLLSEYVEAPISQAIKGGFEIFSEFLNRNPKLVFQWLSLIYYKVHFRDFSLRYHADRRHSDIPIGALYAWPNFHHIFCVARSTVFDAQFSSGVIGTIKVYELKEWERHGSYDYRDHWVTDTMFIRIKNICIYVSFTDAKAVDHMIQDKFARVPQRINFIQATEIFGDFVAAKLHFNQQHAFHSIYDPDADSLQIVAEIADDFDWHDLDPGIRGTALIFAFQKEFGNFTIGDLSHEDTYNQISSGEITFFPLEGESDYIYVEHGPPDDSDHLKKVAMKSADQETVRRAFRTLTKDYYGEE